MTLSDAFQRAGWRTVGDVPSNGEDWPEGASFYHYDKIYVTTTSATWGRVSAMPHARPVHPVGLPATGTGPRGTTAR